MAQGHVTFIIVFILVGQIVPTYPQILENGPTCLGAYFFVIYMCKHYIIPSMINHSFFGLMQCAMSQVHATLKSRMSKDKSNILGY